MPPGTAPGCRIPPGLPVPHIENLPLKARAPVPGIHVRLRKCKPFPAGRPSQNSTDALLSPEGSASFRTHSRSPLAALFFRIPLAFRPDPPEDPGPAIFLFLIPVFSQPPLLQQRTSHLPTADTDSAPARCRRRPCQARPPFPG